MKIVVSFFILLFSLQIQAQSACKCNCDPVDRRLCAPLYDIHHPCGTLCRNLGPHSPPIGRTACPTVKFYNEEKGVEEWRTFCYD
ncbi:MAG: hypothetical protein H0T84_07095 [Tatlockia sp.]|nr:hypothetical protein [Tatlockia sp.]